MRVFLFTANFSSTKKNPNTSSNITFLRGEDLSKSWEEGIDKLSREIKMNQKCFQAYS